jgi:hypothetical protein
VKVLYENLLRSKADEFRYLAMLHGAKIDDKMSPQSDVSTSEPKVPLFGDPEEYKNLSEEEQQVLTDKMLSKHRIWSGQAL